MFDQLRALSEERTLVSALERVDGAGHALRAAADGIEAILGIGGLAVEYEAPGGCTERELRGTLAGDAQETAFGRTGRERIPFAQDLVIPFGDERGGRGRIVLHAPEPVTIAEACTLERFAVILSERLRELENAARRDALSRDGELLIRELRHRYRNSLQRILNLLPLVIPEVSPGIREDIEDRIGTLLGLQELFDWTEGDGRVSVLSYFSQVTEMLRSTVMTGPSVLRAEYDVDRETGMGREQAATIALIVHELVINALKHAEDRPPGMRLRLERRGKQLVLIFRNGFEGHAAEKKSRYGAAACRGLGIIDGLVGRAGGRREDSGASPRFFQASFPL